MALRPKGGRFKSKLGDDSEKTQISAFRRVGMTRFFLRLLRVPILKKSFDISAQCF